MQAWRTTSVLVCFWAFSLGCGWVRGCQRGLALSYVDLAEPPQKGLVDRAVLEQAVRDNLSAWPDFVFRSAAPDEPEWHGSVRIDFLVETTTQAKTQRSAGLSIGLSQIRPAGERHLLREVVTRDMPIEWAALVREGVRHGMERLEAKRRLWRGTDEALLAALGGEDTHLKRTAIAVAAERKLKLAVPLLTEIVRSGESEVEILEAIGALVSIGDPSSSSVLIDAGRRRPPGYLLPIIYGLGQLGGREAEAYLFTVQSGHPEPELRKAAQEALETLERAKNRSQGAR